MRKTAFGDTVIESADDDLGEAIMDHEAGTIYAPIRKDDMGDGGPETKGKFFFEIMENESGEEVASSDPIFDDAQAARKYLTGWLPNADIQVG